MDTIGIDEIIENKPSDKQVEVLVGLDPETPKKRLELYCGDDGTIINDAGFNIYRVRVTVECLRDLKVGAEQFVDFIEPAAHETKISWDTEYDADYSTSD